MSPFILTLMHTVILAAFVTGTAIIIARKSAAAAVTGRRLDTGSLAANPQPRQTSA